VVSDVDVVFDTIGGETQRTSFAALRPGGHLVSTVMPLDEATAKAKGVSASVVSLTRSLDGARFKAIVDDIRDKSIQVLIDRTAPMGQIGAALDRQMSGRARGKIILTIR
jgi:NADPH:quinone reductase-like Zn-dependent oxidoreductase